MGTAPSKKYASHVTIHEAVCEEHHTDTAPFVTSHRFRGPLNLVFEDVDQVKIPANDVARYIVDVWLNSGYIRTFELSGPHALQRTVQSCEAAGIFTDVQVVCVQKSPSPPPPPHV